MISWTSHALERGSWSNPKWWWGQSGNESSLGMSRVYRHWNKMGPHPALVPGDVEAASFFFFFAFSSSPHSVNTSWSAVSSAHYSQISTADESLIATTGSWWLVATMKLTYWFTPAGPVWALCPYNLVPRLSHITLLIVLKCSLVPRSHPDFISRFFSTAAR